SICASAGVVSVVQSGPSWLRDWASEGCDHSAASASATITIRRCIESLLCDGNRQFVAAAALTVQSHSPGGQMVLGHSSIEPCPPASQAHPRMKTDEILSRISEFCRQADMAESTFGRRSVNDGKLVHRLREGKRITIDTLDRIQAYIAASTPGGVAPP